MALKILGLNLFQILKLRRRELHRKTRKAPLLKALINKVADL